MDAVFFAAIVFAGFLAALRAAGFVPAAFFLSESEVRFAFAGVFTRASESTPRSAPAFEEAFRLELARTGIAFFRVTFAAECVLRFVVAFVAERTAAERLRKTARCERFATFLVDAPCVAAMDTPPLVHYGLKRRTRRAASLQCCMYSGSEIPV